GIAHGPSGEPDLAALRAQHAREQPQQRRLARAVGTDDAEDLAALDGERQPRKRERPLAPTRGPRVGEGDVAELNERRQSGRLRVRRIHTKKGAPQKAVITPTESSAGATTLRASVSAASRNAPPASAAVGTRKRLSWPTSRRNTCGTISPTKPMGPVNATTVPVSSAAATNTRRLSRSASTPSWREASSPSASRFSSRALFRISQTPAPARTAKSSSEAARAAPASTAAATRGSRRLRVTMASTDEASARPASARATADGESPALPTKSAVTPTASNTRLSAASARARRRASVT